MRLWTDTRLNVLDLSPRSLEQSAQLGGLLGVPRSLADLFEKRVAERLDRHSVRGAIICIPVTKIRASALHPQFGVP